MHLRSVRFDGGGRDGVERAVSAFDRLSRPVRRQPGCVAMVLLADHEAGRLVVASRWATEGAMNASEEAATEAGGRVVAEHGLRILDVERYEILCAEWRHPPAARTHARVITGRGAGDRVDHTGAVIRDQLLPTIAAQAGFRSVTVAMNRQSGRLIGVSTWAERAARDASTAALLPARRRLMEAMGSPAPLGVEFHVVEFADTRVAHGGSQPDDAPAG